MFANPPRAIHAAKVAFGVVLVYWLAMQWGWAKPMWAAFAVIFCSLLSQGESLNKSALRLWGTIIGGLAALLLIAMFGQDRWLMLVAVSGYLAVVVYVLTGGRDAYMWQTSCVVLLVIVPAASGDSAYVFQTGVERMLETALGCCVWALIDMLVLPVTNAAKLDQTAKELVGVHRQLFDWCRQQSLRTDSEPVASAEYSALRGQELKLVAALEKALTAAGAESYEVRSRRTEWKEFLAASQSLVLAFDQWQSGLIELARIDMAATVAGLDELLAATETGLRDNNAIWSGQPAAEAASRTDLQLGPGNVEGLGHFDEAAILVSVENLREVGGLISRLNRTSRRLHDLPVVAMAATPEKQPPDLLLPLLDPDRLRAVAFIVILSVSSFLLWVWFDPPGHASVWTITTLFGVIATSMPHLSIGGILFRVFAFVLPVAALVYIFIMPTLSSFAGLAVLMFGYYFAVQYWLTNPLAVMLASVGFLLMTGIANVQSYSFVGISIAYLFILMSTSLVAVGGYLLGTPRPEKRLLGMLRRYFRSADYVLRTMPERRPGGRGPIAEWRTQFCERELATLPKKMRLWAGQINMEHFPANSQEQVAGMLDGLVSLNYRLRELLLVRDVPQSPIMVEHFSQSVADWRRAIGQVFARIGGEGGEPVATAELRQELDRRLRSLEESLSELLESESGGAVTREERANAYRVLGGYRGVSNAALGWLEHAGQMDFDDWRRECFS